MIIAYLNEPTLGWVIDWCCKGCVRRETITLTLTRTATITLKLLEEKASGDREGAKINLCARTTKRTEMPPAAAMATLFLSAFDASCDKVTQAGTRTIELLRFAFIICTSTDFMNRTRVRAFPYLELRTERGKGLKLNEDFDLGWEVLWPGEG